MHTLLSSQLSGVASHAPVCGLHASAPLHALPSPPLQVTAAGVSVPWQLPPLQVSFWVQALPSLHPSVLFMKVQPVCGSHMSVVQALPSLQLGVWPATHWPFAGLQVSTPLQALPSVQTIGAPA